MRDSTPHLDTSQHPTMAPNQQDVNGSIVAFEGHSDTISTQLRLLPTSSQILIIPGLECYLPDDICDQSFEARKYIRTVHDALVSRNKSAREFLHGATSTSKRLVFMNGGTPSAQALCVKALMKHTTRGDRIQAEAAFSYLTKDGLAGLEGRGKGPSARTGRVTSYGCAGDDDVLSDPISRAMRAADALDRQTANLQESNELDLTLGSRPRSLSLPLYGYTDDFGDAAPFYVFGAHYEDDSEAENDSGDDETIVSPKTILPANSDRAAKAASTGNLNLSATSPSCVGEAYEPAPGRRSKDTDMFSSTSEAFSIRTLDNVVYGEASLLDMRLSAQRGSISRVKSLDRIYPASPKFRDLCIPAETPEAELHPHEKDRPQSFMVVSDENDPSAIRLNHLDGPRTIVVKTRRPTIKIEPVPIERKNKSLQNPVKRPSYVDKGTDASEVPQVADYFQPVLSCTEDLIVYLKDGKLDEVLASVINVFKNRSHPVLTHSESASESDANDSTPDTPQYHSSPDQNHTVHVSNNEANIISSSNGDFDPYAYLQSTIQPPKGQQNIPAVAIVKPPTPAQTPPPSVMEKEDRFPEFNVTPGQTAVAIQNSLRSILNVYFPPETEGYRQFQFSLLPELEGMWKPIFPAANSGNSQKDGGRNVEHILAIGSQKGVKKEYSSGIVGQLEKYGIKSSGDHGRSGRLDFRYLLANAMQAFTAQPLANQTSDNPFTNPYILATLIIPHLETYMTLHSEVKYLLLEYPPEHLPTILALQKLVGVEVIKVAQIVDPNGNEPLPFTHISGASMSNKPESKSSSPSPRSSSDIAASKANFLLTSTASDTDIATFISAVWNFKADVSSDSDIPSERSRKRPSGKRKSRPAPLSGGFSAFPKANGPQSPLSSMTAVMSGSSSPGRSNAPSFTETLKTLGSGRSLRGRAMTRRRLRHRDTDSVADSTDAGEESEFDLEERRLMPMFMHNPNERKGNTRKALKFLGLA